MRFQIFFFEKAKTFRYHAMLLNCCACDRNFALIANDWAINNNIINWWRWWPNLPYKITQLLTLVNSRIALDCFMMCDKPHWLLRFLINPWLNVVIIIQWFRLMSTLSCGRQMKILQLRYQAITMACKSVDWLKYETR